jgi:hypothetical protein
VLTIEVPYIRSTIRFRVLDELERYVPANVIVPSPGALQYEAICEDDLLYWNVRPRLARFVVNTYAKGSYMYNDKSPVGMGGFTVIWAIGEVMLEVTEGPT